MTVRVPSDPHVVGRLVALQRGAQFDGSRHLGIEVIYEAIEVRPQLHAAWHRGPSRCSVVRLQLKAQAEAFLPRVTQPHPPVLFIDDASSQQLR